MPVTDSGVWPFLLHRLLLLLLLIGNLLTSAGAETTLRSVGSPCDPEFLECDGGKTCVPDSNICDSIPDCADGEDEYGCFCRHVGLKVCRWTMDGQSDCYDPKKECDGVADCIEGTDEENCLSLPEVTSASPRINSTQSLTTSPSTSPFFYAFYASHSSSSSSGPFTYQVQIITESHTPETPRSDGRPTDKPEIPLIGTALGGFRNGILTVDVKSPADKNEVEHPFNANGNGTAHGRELTCNTAGTRSSLGGRTPTYCPCKKHVTGILCDDCKDKTFHLHEKNKHGCLKCFCMNKSKVCHSSALYRTKLRKKRIRCGSNRNLKFLTGAKEAGDSEFTECQLPREFLGDKISSYGGVLKMDLRGVSRNATIHLFLRGYGVVLERTDKPRKGKERSMRRKGKERSVRVKLVEKNWKLLIASKRSRGVRRASREDLITALAALRSLTLRIRTADTLTPRITLRRVSLDVATSNHSTSKGEALEVEECECPEGYTGTSCQTCSQGYRKVRVKYGPPEYIRFVCRKETTDSNLRKIRRKKFCLEFHPGTSLPVSITKIYNSYCVTSVDKKSSPQY